MITTNASNSDNLNTITAKELRDNLGDIAKRVEAGEHIYVSYRNKLSFKLEPAKEQTQNKERFAGLKALQEAQKSIKIPEKLRTSNLKELYREDMAKKYKIYEG